MFLYNGNRETQVLHPPLKLCNISHLQNNILWRALVTRRYSDEESNAVKVYKMQIVACRAQMQL